MTVLLDLEWIGEQEKHLTQLSAVRVDSVWAVAAEFNALVNPGDFRAYTQNSLPFGGYDIMQFIHGMTEQECIRKLEKWMLPDDEIWVWAKSNKGYLSELWHNNARRLCPTVLSLAKSVRQSIEWDCSSMNPYGILSFLGEQTPAPEHRASNDVAVLRRLLAALHFTKEKLSEENAVTLTVRPSQKEINRRKVEKSEYHFIYLNDTKIFHRRTCPLWQNAADEKDICGSIYYKTAAKNRTPCNFCKPRPQAVDFDYERRHGTDKDTSRAGSESSAEQSKNDYLGKPDPYEIVRVRLLTGDFVELKRGKIVGWCHYVMHPGAIDKHICIEHDCLGKQCFYFEQSPLSFYIDSLETEKRKKEQRKIKQKTEKQKQIAQADNLTTLQQNWQNYLNEIGSDMQIVRIEKASIHEYRIFYASDNLFADGNRYPEFIAMLKKANHRCRIVLRHIRDVDGHFVTRDEYRSMRLK